MITASHNPPEYNGYKVYGEDGGQLPPKEADELTKFVYESWKMSLSVPVLTKEELLEKGLLQYIGEDVDKVYLDHVQSIQLNKEQVEKVGDDLKIVFTPLMELPINSFSRG